MRISGVNDIYDYSRIDTQHREIPQVNPSQEQPYDDGQVTEKKQPSQSGTADGRPKGISVYEAAGVLGSDKELIGLDSDIRQLDVEKAVSSMKRDSVLQGYQYFVGNIATEDGAVRRKG